MLSLCHEIKSGEAFIVAGGKYQNQNCTRLAKSRNDCGSISMGEGEPQARLIITLDFS